MCYGSLDPKYMMRDIEARVKPMTFTQKSEHQAAPVLRPGFLAEMRKKLARVLQKGSAHV